MTLNDLLRKAQALAMQLSSGDIPLSKDVDFEIATYKGESFGIIVDVKEPGKEMIEELETPYQSIDSGLVLDIPELVDKINEIIRYINEKEEENE